MSPPQIHIYNTMSRAKEPLLPLEEGHVKLYVCGITSYDFCHIGHARSALVFDMVARYLRHRGYEVTFVRNFTDIDDKIIDRANKLGEEAAQLARRFIDEFYVDMDALGAVRPDIEPRATGHIPEMLALIQKLVDKDLAYASGGDVFFRVARFPEYGRLAGRTLDDMLAGARVEVNENKENPMDFALWKAAKPGEPQWDSPWGPGRPGWHIECSAMSRKYLGESFDIHGGGKDLVFPHHENEIAQSRGAGCGFARLWMHHGFVTIKEEKMSKSLGNFLTIREVLKKWHPEILRLFIFSAHYRSPIDFNEQALRDAQSGLSRLYACLERLERVEITPDVPLGNKLAPDEEAKLAGLAARFEEAMDNDFNTAQAIAQLFDAAKQAHPILDRLDKTELGMDGRVALRELAQDMRELGGILGILQQPNRAAIEQSAGGKEERLAELGLSEEAIAAKIAERAEARKAKNWAASDAIRDELANQGIALKDGPQGTTWAFREE